MSSPAPDHSWTSAFHGLTTDGVILGVLAVIAILVSIAVHLDDLSGKRKATSDLERQELRDLVAACVRYWTRLNDSMKSDFATSRARISQARTELEEFSDTLVRIRAASKDSFEFGHAQKLIVRCSEGLIYAESVATIAPPASPWEKRSAKSASWLTGLDDVAAALARMELAEKAVRSETTSLDVFCIVLYTCLELAIIAIASQADVLRPVLANAQVQALHDGFQTLRSGQAENAQVATLFSEVLSANVTWNATDQRVRDMADDSPEMPAALEEHRRAAIELNRALLRQAEQLLPRAERENDLELVSQLREKKDILQKRLAELSASE